MTLTRFRQGTAALVAIAGFVSGPGVRLIADSGRVGGVTAVGVSTPLRGASGVPQSRALLSVSAFDGSGSVYVQASSASPSADALVRFVRSLRTNRNTIDSWRSVADRYAATQGARRAVRLRALIDAFSAEDDVAFHNAVGRLGVSVFSTSERYERGQEGTATRFAIDGVVKLRVFRPDGHGEPTKAREMDSSEPLHGPAADAAVAVQEDCGGDPCATQQEVDDALVMLVAIDDEATAVDAEMNAEYAARGSVVAGCRCHGHCSVGRADVVLLCSNRPARLQAYSNAIAKGDGGEH